MFVSNWTFANLIKLRSINNTLFFVILVFIVCYINEATIFYTTIILALCYLELLLRGSRISVLFLIELFYKDLLDVTNNYALSNFLLWQQRRKVNIHAIITSFLSITFHQQLSLCLLNNGCQLTINSDNICRWHQFYCYFQLEFTKQILAFKPVYC